MAENPVEAHKAEVAQESEVARHMREMREANHLRALEQKLTVYETFLRNTATSLEEGDDPLKVADDIHDALGEGRPNNTEAD